MSTVPSLRYTNTKDCMVDRNFVQFNGVRNQFKEVQL
jgi:hypothetical protein